MADRIYIVMGGGVVLMAYQGVNGPTLAGMHSRCVSGATVVPCDLLDSLPPEIRDDITTEWDASDDEDTPVTEVAIHELDDATPRKG